MKINRSGPASRRRSGWSILILALLVGLIAAGYLLYRTLSTSGTRTQRLWNWLRDPEANPGWAVKAGEHCGDAPFQMPTNGYIGFIWGDSFGLGHQHQGLDIFSGTDVNQAPVVTAYPGYLTRLSEWKSSVIVRIPDDPLLPGRQIWTYYTHMAGSDGESFVSPEFPPGVQEIFVEAGTLLGYQGNYSGDPGNPVGVHLHFSIVLDDGQGNFLNELKIENTLDPSAYLGLPLNAAWNQDQMPVCEN